MGLKLMFGILITYFLMIYQYNAESLESNLIGVITKDLENVNQKVIKLKDFVYLDSIGIVATRDDILIQTHGLYSITCQVLIETNSTQRLSLEINIDDEKHSSFKSITENKGEFPLSVSGIFKVNRNLKVQLFLRTQKKLLAVKKNSHVSLTLLSRTDRLQAFSVRMTPPVWEYKINRLKEVSFQLWTEIASVASFIDSNLFVVANGYLVAVRDGVYIVAVNMIIASEEERLCKHSIVMKKNERQVIGVQNIMAEPMHWSTISFLRFVLLNRNDRVWFDVSSTCNKVIRAYPDSTFSMSELKSDFHGLSLGLSEYLSAKQGWFTPDLTLFKTSLSSHFKIYSNIEISQTHLTVTETGYIFVSINMELNMPMTRKSNDNIILAMCKNLYLDGHDNIEQVLDQSKISWVKSKQQPSTFTSLQLSAKFSVNKMDLIRIYLNIPSSKWLLLKNSSISISFFPRQSIVIDLPSRITLHSSIDWQLLSSCLNYTDEYLRKLPDNLMQVRENGVYQAIIDFEISELVERIDIELALIFYMNNKKTIILYTKENEIDFKKTFKLSSSVRFHTDNRFGIFVRSNKPGKIDGKCRARFQYFGDHNSIVGFQANLKTDYLINGNAGYFNLNNFQNYENNKETYTTSNIFFNTQGVFNMKNGVFTAPTRGVYLVSINLVVKEVIMTSSQNYVATTVKINDKESPLFNLKQHNLIHNGGRAVRNSTISFCLSGAVHLVAHDKVSIEVFVKSDDRWSIDRKSSFSIILLSQRQNGFIAYRPSNKLENIHNGAQKLITGWEASETSPPYGMFFGSTLDSPTVQDKSHIFFTRTGLYMISMNILLNHQETDKEIVLKLIKQTTGNSDNEVIVQCDRVKMTYQVTSASCQNVRIFEKNDLYSFILESSTSIGVGDLYDHQSNDQNMAFLSVMLLGEIASFQAGLYELKNDFEYSLDSNTIKPWRPNPALYPIGNTEFDAETGSLFIRAKGWFLFTVALECRRYFGNATIYLVRLGDAPGKSLIKSKGECHNNKKLLSLAGLQYLGDNEYINIKLSGYGGGHIIAKHTHFSFAYLKQKLIQRYYVNKKATYFVVGDTKKYFDQPISWCTNLDEMSPTTRNLTFKESGVYMVTVNIITKTNSVDLEVKIFVNGMNRLIHKKQESNMPDSRTVTISFTGALVLRRGNADVTVNLKSNTKTSIEESSSVSVAFMDTDYIEYPTIVLRMKEKNIYQRWRLLDWRHVHDFSLDVLSKFFYEDARTVIPMFSGYYLLSCNIIVSLDKPSLVTLGLWLDEEIALNMTEHVTILDTLSISKVLYLKQGSRSSLKIWHSSKDGYTIEAGSTWSFVLLDSPKGSGQVPMTPVVTKDLIIGNVIPVQGDEELYCDVIGADKYKYIWYFNNTVLNDEASYALHPNKYFKLGSGRYQCQAIANGIGPLSRSAFIKIKAINECDRQKGICIGDDSTCFDNLVGYTCGCVNSGYKYFHRKGCILEKEIQHESSAPLLILILVVCLTILIVLVCSIYICMRRRQSHRSDPERQSVVGAENPDDITMQSLNNSLAEDYSDVGTLDHPSRNGSLTTVDDSTLLVRNNTTNGCSRTRQGHHTRHYLRSRSETEPADTPNSQRRWLLLNNTQV